MNPSPCAQGPHDKIPHAGGSAALRLRKAAWALALALLTAGVASAIAPRAAAQDFGYRQMQGKVYGDHGQPINGAVVYLSNSRNDNVKTYISDTDGSYRFAGLADDTNYTVWAAYKGKKSSRRTLTTFDQRKQVYFDLHIPVEVPKS